MHLGIPVGRSVGWWNGAGIGQRLFIFYEQLWRSLRVLHFVKQRSQDKSMLCCKLVLVMTMDLLFMSSLTKLQMNI